MPDETASEYLTTAKEQDYDHPDEAIAACNEAVRLDPLYIEAYLERATRWYHKNQVDAAIDDCNTAIRIKPDSVEAYLERGYLRDFGMDDIDGAIADYTEAIRIDPHSWDAYMD